MMERPQSYKWLSAAEGPGGQEKAWQGWEDWLRRLSLEGLIDKRFRRAEETKVDEEAGGP